MTPDQRCFLDFAERSRERAIETALTERLQDTLAELGPGFAFVGRQVAFTVDGDEFFVDLLLFHAEQVRYVVVELKVGKFRRVRWAARLLRHHGR